MYLQVKQSSFLLHCQRINIFLGSIFVLPALFCVCGNLGIKSQSVIAYVSRDRFFCVIFITYAKFYLFSSFSVRFRFTNELAENSQCYILRQVEQVIYARLCLTWNFRLLSIVVQIVRIMKQILWNMPDQILKTGNKIANTLRKKEKNK